jgi:tetratricopeptide (TPR) repeat protein
MINESQRFCFEHVYSLNRLNILRVHSRLEEPETEPASSTLTFNMNLPFDLMKCGRLAVKNERYGDARLAFSTLQAQFPHLSDIVYQILLVNTFTLNTLAATQNLQELYLSTTSTSYIAPARVHIYAMNSLLAALSNRDSIRRAEQFYEVGRTYWNLGYPRQAYRMMKQATQADSLYFTGYLWAWHYGTQIGETSEPNKFLQRLAAIDRTNPIVQSFVKMTAIYDRLQHTSNPLQRGELHLALSREYSSIDLHDEALDEAQRAIGSDPKNREAWLLLAHLFEKKGSTLGTQRASARASALKGKP